MEPDDDPYSFEHLFPLALPTSGSTFEPKNSASLQPLSSAMMIEISLADDGPTQSVIRQPRTRQPPVQLNDYFACLAVATPESDIEEPANYQATLRSLQHKEWMAAMEDKYASLMENGTWELQDLPKSNRATIHNKWVYKVKVDAAGNVERYKACLVAKEYTQRASIDFTKTFSPVAKFDSIRSVLSVATLLDMELT
jgi:hypothetical protein